MFLSRLTASSLAVLLLLPGSGFSAQSSSSSSPSPSSQSSNTKKKKASSGSSTSKTKSSAKKSHAPRKKATSARTIQLHKSFVASSDLRPMAQQLIDYRTPAAYAGVEGYAVKHAGSEPGALAWFAIGYAHYLDAQYPAAVSAMQKAEPYIGELKDYTAFFIGNSYVLSNSPESSLTYLRDFGTRFPDSVYASDATLAYARALLATNQPETAIQVLSKRSGDGADNEYLLGKAYVQNGQGRTGAEILRKVYYNHPTSQQADWAENDLKKIPEAAMLPAVTYSEHERRANGLYQGRRWQQAADEYKATAAI